MKKIVLTFFVLAVLITLTGCMTLEKFEKRCIDFGMERELRSKAVLTRYGDSVCLVYFEPFGAWISIQQFTSLR